MENYIFIILVSLLTLLIIFFVIFIVDYLRFKDRIEKILNLNIESNNEARKVIIITKKVNDSVGQICELNNKIIFQLNNLLKENNFLRNKLKDKKEIDEENNNNE